MQLHSPYVARIIAVALVVFVLCSAVAFVAVTVVAKVAIILSVFAGISVLTVVRGRDFFRNVAPFPETVLVFGWLTFAVGTGWFWKSLPMNASLLFLFTAPVAASCTLLWSIIRFIKHPRLMPFITLTVATLSAFIFAASIVQI